MSTNFLGGGVVLDEAGRPLDQIILTGVTATGYHGVLADERRDGQVFRADVVIHLDTRRAAASDDLTRTVDYGVLAEAVAGVLTGEPADLVETVAERIAATALADPAIAAVDVAVHKPQAPITVPFDDVVVRIHRDRHKLPAAAPWRRPEQPRPAGHPGPDGAAHEVRPPQTAAAPAVTPAPAGGVVPPAAGAGSHIGAPTAAAPGGDGPDRLDEPPAGPVEAVLALGGNLGAPQGTLREAVADIERIAGVEILAVSPLARTAAVGGPGQPDYLNAVVIVRTTLAPRALLHAVQSIEQQHGRERLERWGPRTLDIDVITHGSTLAVTDDLELPHPRAHQRAFVLQPWAQIAPDAVLPGLGGGPVAALAATAPDRDGVRWLALDWMTAALPSGPRDDRVEALPPSPSDAAPDVPAGEEPDGVPAQDGAHGAAPADGAAVPAAAAAGRPGSAPERAPAVDGGPSTAVATDLADPGARAEHVPSAEVPSGSTAGAAAAGADRARAGDGPLDWLPALPAPGGSRTTPGALETPGPGGAGPTSSIFPPVVAPGDDGLHPGDRQP